MLAIIIDITVMVLLTLTIFFCWRLNNKISELKSGRKDLVELVKTLDSAIVKTNTNIAELKVMSKNSAAELHISVAKAQELLNDLSFINETAVKLADRMEKSIGEARFLNDKMRSNIEHVTKELGNPSPQLQPNNDTTRPSSTTKGTFIKTREELLAALKFARQG